MSKQKIDRVELHKMLKAGKTQKECAAFFKVSEVAIWKAKRGLNVAVVKSATMEAAHTVLEQDIDVRAKMIKASETVDRELDRALGDIANASGSDKRAIQKVIVDLCGEIRKQTSTFLEAVKIWSDHVDMATFQREALETIGEANISPCCRAEVVCSKCGQKVDLRALIIQRLKQARALRSRVELRP